MSLAPFVKLHATPLFANRPWRTLTKSVVVGRWRYTLTAQVSGEAVMHLDLVTVRHRRGFLRRMLGLPGRTSHTVSPRFASPAPCLIANTTLTRRRA